MEKKGKKISKNIVTTARMKDPKQEKKRIQRRFESLSVTSITGVSIAAKPSTRYDRLERLDRLQRRGKKRSIRRVEDKEVIDEIKECCKEMMSSTFLRILFRVFFLIWISGFIIYAQVLWYKSLETCKDDIIICLKEMQMKFFTILKFIFLFGLLHFLVVVQSLMLRDKFLQYTGTIIGVGSYLFRAFTSKGISAEDHSFANIMLSFLAIFVATMILLWFIATLEFFKKRAVYGFLWIIGFTAFIYYIYWNRVLNSCVHLNDSLDDRVRYSEQGPECKWFKPKICWHYTIDGIFKPLYYGKDTCEKADTTDLFDHKRM